MSIKSFFSNIQANSQTIFRYCSFAVVAAMIYYIYLSIQIY